MSKVLFEQKRNTHLVGIEMICGGVGIGQSGTSSGLFVGIRRVERQVWLLGSEERSMADC